MRPNSFFQNRTSKPALRSAVSLSSCSRRKGFTAVEVAMVATVIAIISLLVLPIFRNRAEEAREAAVLDEISNMAKMMLLAEADISGQPRLQDLDKPQLTGTEPLGMMPWNGTITMPIQTFSPSNIRANWGGPYLAFSARNSAPIGSPEVAQYWYSNSDQNGFIVVKNNNPLTVDFGGTIGVQTINPARAPQVTEVEDNYTDDLYPLDPWGSPYVFFGRGPINSTESEFNTNLIVSFGPDGVVGTTGNGILNGDAPLYRRYDGSGTGEIGNPIFAINSTNADGDYIYRF